MTWAPTIVASARTPCMPWRLRDGEGRHPMGAVCVDCGIDVALDPALTAYNPVCIYCALSTGLLPLAEIEPDDERTLHDMAVQEGSTPAMCRARSKP